MTEATHEAAEVPAWVHDGTWRPWHLKVIGLVRRHLCLLLVCAILIFGEASREVIFALPLSLLIDWAIAKLSWISRLSPEAIYCWQVSADKTRYSDAIIDAVTGNRQFSRFFLVAAAFILPFAIYQVYFSEYVVISKLFYLFFVVFMGATFLISLFYITSDRANIPATPQKFVEERGLLRRFHAKTVSAFVLLEAVPALLLFWVPIHGSSGFGPIHLAAMSGCMVLVSFIYHSEYNITLMAIASSVEPSQQSSKNR